MGIRLRFEQESQWLDVIPGLLRVQHKPVTYVEQACAEAYAERMMRQLSDGREAIKAAGGHVDKLPEELDREAALRDLYYAQGLGRQIIEAWEGPVEDDGSPSPVTPQNIDEAIRGIPYFGKLLMQRVQVTIVARMLEGNGSGGASNGASTAAGGSAPTAAMTDSPAAAEGAASTDSDAPSSSTGPSPTKDDSSSS